MNTATKNDLEDMAFILEGLVKRLPKLKLQDQIDVGARIRAVAKHAETIKDYVKDEISKKAKDKAEVGKPYHVKGEAWAAVVSLVPTTRLDQTMLKVEYPDIHAECSKSKPEQRINFEPR